MVWNTYFISRLLLPWTKIAYMPTNQNCVLHASNVGMPSKAETRICFDVPPIIFNRSSNQQRRLILIMYLHNDLRLI